MIQVDRLVKTYGSIIAVREISFEVAKGEIVGFLGPNGAGKSTTMRILAGFVPANRGRAIVAGYDVMQQSLDVRRHIGYLPENVPMYGEMRVEEYLDYRAKLKEVPRRERATKIHQVMERCAVTDRARQLIGTLSKGYRQRVGLAEAMLHDPDILILDEPTVGLDPNQIVKTRELIKELSEQHTILLSTHILDEVERVCERVIIIAGGQITLTSSLEDLRRDSFIRLEVRGPEVEVHGVLETIEGVAQVTQEGAQNGIVGFNIKTKNNEDLREAISERLGQNGWTLRQLDLRRQTLEVHFVQATRRAEEM